MHQSKVFRKKISPGTKASYRAVIIDLRGFFKKAAKAGAALLIIILIFCGMFVYIKGLGGKISSAAKKISHSTVQFFLGFDPKDPKTLLKSALPFANAAQNSPLWALSESTAETYNPQNADTKETSPDPQMPENTLKKNLPIKSIDGSQNKSLSGTDKKILVKNETGYSVDVQKMLAEGTPFVFDKKGPQILILHTHATESYSPEGAETYDSSESDRTQNTEKNMVKVGEEMVEIFKQKGIEVLHAKKLHDYPNYNGSYGNSLKTAEEYLKKYPSVKMILDIHRDAIVYSDGTKAKVSCTIDGQAAAQLMFVIGTDAGGLEHQNWQKNMQTAVNLQAAAEKKYPGLMRGINLRKERFNEHLTAGSMIIEVGTSGNTLSEAVFSARCIAGIIADELSPK